MSKVWDKQPPAGMQIDWTNPITQGLVFAFNGADPNVEAVSRVTASTMNVSTIGGHKKMVGRSGENSSSLIEFTNCFDASEAFFDEATMFSIYRPHERFTIANTGVLLFSGGNINYPMIRLGWVDNATDAVQMRVSTAAGTNRTSLLSANDIAPPGEIGRTIGVVRGDGTNSLTGEVWHNGINVVASSALINQTQTIVGASLSDSATVLGDNDLQDRGACVDLFLSLCWNRALSEAEIQSIDANPWQIFKPQPSFALADVPTDVRHAKVPRVRTKQPPAGISLINYDVPFAWDARDVFDSSRNHRALTFANSPPLVGTEMGQARDFNGTTQTVTVGDDDVLNFQTNALTIFCLWIPRSNTGIQTLVRKANLTDKFILRQNSNALEFYTDTSLTGQVFMLTGSVLQSSKLNKPHVVVARYDGAFISLWLDGGEVGTALAQTGTLLSDTADLNIAGRAADRWLNGQMGIVVIDDRAWSESEIVSRSNNPWQLFKSDEIIVPINESLPDVGVFERSW